MPISSCLVDTNILLRMTRRSDPQHEIVNRAIFRLASDSTSLCYTHQNIAELWNAMTRPVARNGLGLSVADAEREVRAIESGMTSWPMGKASIENGAESSYSTALPVFRYTMHD